MLRQRRELLPVQRELPIRHRVGLRHAKPITGADGLTHARLCADLRQMWWLELRGSQWMLLIDGYVLDEV